MILHFLKASSYAFKFDYLLRFNPRGSNRSFLAEDWIQVSVSECPFPERLASRRSGMGYSFAGDFFCCEVDEIMIAERMEELFAITPTPP